MKKRKIIVFGLLIALLINSIAGIGGKKIETKAEEATLAAPRVEEDSTMASGYLTTWDCVWFGSYPQAEVIDTEYYSTYSVYDSRTRAEGDLIVSDEEYKMLKNASGWDENGDIVLNGNKYRRLSVEDQNQYEGFETTSYFWPEEVEYHYFKYEPIRWRVLWIENGKALLLSDIALDAQGFNNTASTGAIWANSVIRQKLNQVFYQDAFDYYDKKAIISTEIQTSDAKEYGVDGGPDTLDSLFLLSGDDFKDNQLATQYGFVSDNYAAMSYGCYASTYTRARGIDKDAYRESDSGQCSWWLRTPAEIGTIEQEGQNWICSEAAGKSDVLSVDSWKAFGIRPALYLELSSVSQYEYAGTVSSDGTYHEESKTKEKVVLSNPKMGEEKTENNEPVVTWDKLSFGSYPQAEVIPEQMEYSAYDTQLLQEGDLIRSDEIYVALENATDWNEKDEVEIGGEKYRRVRKEDATGVVENDTEYYQWADEESYHYFKYEPIQWGVLQVEDGKAFLLTDKVIDDRVFHSKNEEVTWDRSEIRSWLNGYTGDSNTENQDYQQENFLDMAFDSAQQEAICETNLPYETLGQVCGNNTTDKIFLLSLSDCGSGLGDKYGFPDGDSEYRDCLEVAGSTYALAMGWLHCEENQFIGEAKAGGKWWLRSPGYDEWWGTTVVNGMAATYQKADNRKTGVRPALYLDLEDSSLYSYVGSVSSDGALSGDKEDGADALPEETEPVETEPVETPSIAYQEQENPTPTLLFPTETLPPRIPSIRLKETKDCYVKVSWEKVEMAQMYYIYRSEKKKGAYIFQKSVSLNSSSYIDKTVVPGKTYYYKVIPWGEADIKIQLDMAIRKKITVHYLAQPAIRVKKAKTSFGQKYVQISLKKYQGDYAEIYYKTKEEVQYHKLKIKKKKISGYQQKFRLRYERGGVTLCFKLRTYVIRNGKKRYSGYSKVARKKI